MSFNIHGELKMNPESRIKLLRSLEEIRIFEQNNPNPKTRLVYHWIGLIFTWIVLASVIMSYDIKEKALFLIIAAIPNVLYSVWLLSKTKSDERYKLIANAILELGSISQESQEIEPLKIEAKVIRTKKQITKRKKR